MGSSFISTGLGWPSHLLQQSFYCHSEMSQIMTRPDSFCWACVVLSISHHHPLSFCPIFHSIVIVRNANDRPKEWGGRNCPHHIKQSTKQPYREEHLWQQNYSKTFLQGTVVNVFDGLAPGGEECLLEVDGRFWDALQWTCAWSRIKEGHRPLTALHSQADSGR